MMINTQIIQTIQIKNLTKFKQKKSSKTKIWPECNTNGLPQGHLKTVIIVALLSAIWYALGKINLNSSQEGLAGIDPVFDARGEW